MLEKPKKSPYDPVKYRPICIIDAAGKFLERLINDRISKEMQEKNMLHRNQFGFRKGLSTLNAIAQVKKFVDVINAKATKNRGVCYHNPGRRCKCVQLRFVERDPAGDEKKGTKSLPY